MLIGIFLSCDDGQSYTDDTSTPQVSDCNEESELSASCETREMDLLKIEPSTSGIKLSDEKIREIVWTYIKDNTPDFETTYSITCWGVFNDAYAIIPSQNGYTVVTTETVNGLTFVYPTTTMLQIYYNGEIFSMRDAFEQGIIDEKAVSSLYEIRYLFCLA